MNLLPFLVLLLQVVPAVSVSFTVLYTFLYTLLNRASNTVETEEDVCTEMYKNILVFFSRQWHLPVITGGSLEFMGLAVAAAAQEWRWEPGDASLWGTASGSWFLLCLMHNLKYCNTCLPSAGRMEGITASDLPRCSEPAITMYPTPVKASHWNPLFDWSPLNYPDLLHPYSPAPLDPGTSERSSALSLTPLTSRESATHGFLTTQVKYILLHSLGIGSKCSSFFKTKWMWTVFEQGVRVWLPPILPQARTRVSWTASEREKAPSTGKNVR